jgi:hypothetical protein
MSTPVAMSPSVTSGVPYALWMPERDFAVVTGGGLPGQRGFFTRDDGGAIVGANLAGRLFTRVTAG